MKKKKGRTRVRERRPANVGGAEKRVVDRILPDDGRDLGDVLERVVSQDEIPASDIARLRLSGLVGRTEDRVKYPRGLKSSLRALSKETAEGMLDDDETVYSVSDKMFHRGDAAVDSRTLNVISSGASVLGGGDDDPLFSEGELVDFVSRLASAPMAGMAYEVGMGIYAWIESMHEGDGRRASLDADEYFHCRKRVRDEMPYGWEEMRRAPYGVPQAGRFNPPGSAHFYFASTQEGAENEVRKYLACGEVLQTARIRPKGALDMLDLSGTMSRGKSFLRMIRYPLSASSEGNKMPREYLLPCFVADCCKTVGFDGIAYHGSKSHTNYVCWDDGRFSFVGMCPMTERPQSVGLDGVKT